MPPAAIDPMLHVVVIGAVKGNRTAREHVAPQIEACDYDPDIVARERGAIFATMPKRDRHLGEYVAVLLDGVASEA